MHDTFVIVDSASTFFPFPLCQMYKLVHVAWYFLHDKDF